MLQDDRVAVAALYAAEDDLAVARSLDRRAPGCGVIHPAMGTNRVQDRVAPARVEIGAYTGEVDRRPDKGLSHAVAVRRVVVAAPLVVDEADCLVGSAIVVEFCRYYFSVHDVLAVLPDFFVLDVVVVAGTNIENEVDIPGKDAGDVHDDPVGKTGVHGALEQRGLDRAVGEPLTLLDGPLDDFGLEAALGALDLQSAREAEVRVHADQLTLVVRDFELIAGFQLAKTFARLVELRDFREVAKIEVVLSE